MNTLPDLRQYGNVVVASGAGLSSPSGIPTYRDAGSSWRDERFEELSHASQYGNHLPELWNFWGSLRALAQKAPLNPAYGALRSAARRCEERGGSFTAATQNIDGLHERSQDGEVLELHGSIHRSRCMRRNCQHTFSDAQVPAPGEVPLCPLCGKSLRPDIVLFGENLSVPLLKKVDDRLRSADLCVYVGTSGNVWPVSDLVTRARRSGARCVLVNKEPWDHPHPDFHDTFLGSAEELLPQLLG